MSTERTFTLPSNLEKIFAALSRYYARTGESVPHSMWLQAMLVNSQYHVEEATDYDNRDRERYGHSLFLQVPAQLYCQYIDDFPNLAEQLARDINRLSTSQDEFISRVQFEAQEDALINWREDSGALIQGGPLAQIGSREDAARLWHPEYLRVFVSHASSHKKLAAQLKKAFFAYGVTSFVAHQDIEPTREWQDDIEKALFSMEAMIVILTEGFPASRWTDQEVGVAIGRGVPVIPVRLGVDPYGFIGKFQAVSGDTKPAGELAQEVFDLLFTSFPAIRERVAEALVSRLEGATCFEHANALMGYVCRLQAVPPSLIDRLEKTPEKNSQVEGAFEVRKSLPGLVARLRGATRP